MTQQQGTGGMEGVEQDVLSVCHGLADEPLGGADALARHSVGGATMPIGAGEASEALAAGASASAGAVVQASAAVGDAAKAAIRVAGGGEARGSGDDASGASGSSRGHANRGGGSTV